MAQERQPERRGSSWGGSGGRGGRSRAVWAVLATTGLLALVAVGSLRGPLGSGRGRPSYPADLVNTLILLLLVAVVAAAVLGLVALWPERHLVLAQRRRPMGLLGLLAPLAAVLALLLLRDRLRAVSEAREAATAGTVDPAAGMELPAAAPSPGAVPLVVAGLAVAALLAVVVAQLAADRRRRRPPRTPAERLVELLDDTLEDLELDPDPRRAVIAAWARMERGLAAAGLPRQPAEAPFEYAARVLESALPAPAGSAAVHRLTSLFERAKFSQHRIDQADREAAVAALRAVRQELAAAAEAQPAPAGQGRAGGGPTTPAGWGWEDR